MMRTLNCRLLVPICLVCSILWSNQLGLVSYYYYYYEEKLNYRYYSTGEEQTSLASLRAPIRLNAEHETASSRIIVTGAKRRHVFLGILQSPSDNGRFRTVVRKTYLQQHLQPITICPFAERHSNCDIVYAFIAQTEEVPSSVQDARDVLSLPGEEDEINPLWSMYRYLQDSNLLYDDDQPAGGDHSTDMRFDFVAHTWSTCVLHTDRVWSRRELFDVFAAANESVYDAHRRVFSWGSRATKKDLWKDGYCLLSSTLVHDVLNHPNFHRGVPTQTLEPVLVRTVRDFGRLMLVTDPVHWKQNATSAKYNYTGAIAMLPIHEAASKVNGSTVELISAWERYKAKHLVTTYQDPGEVAFMATKPPAIQTRCRHGPRMLLGIMSVLDDAKEIERRQTIRETYLRYYLDTNSTDKRFRICALHELLDAAHPNHARLLHECQLVYTFVIGGNATGPTERIEYSAAEPITLPSPVSEPDVVMLNIKENMNEGKTQTYFKYGTMLCDEYIYFDYIAKTDTDTLFYVNKFLYSDLNHFPSFPDNGRVYGGWDCVSRSSFAETEGVIYYAGSLFFLSPDMARFITSDACDRQRLDRFAEDWTIGAFVDAHPLPQHRILVGKKSLIHPLKNVTEYRAKWKRYVNVTK